jgi:hypothetical protein
MVVHPSASRDTNRTVIVSVNKWSPLSPEAGIKAGDNSSQIGKQRVELNYLTKWHTDI